MPEGAEILRMLLALVLTLGLLGLLALALRRLRGAAFLTGTAAGKLQLVDSLALDARYRLVRVRAEGADHLLLLGPQQALVVEKNLPQALPMTVSDSPKSP